MPLKIRNWDKHYETSESRKLVSLQWVKIPTRQDSLAYRLIAGHKRGAEIFAAWVLMVQVASKGRKEERGNLPLSPDELGIVTGFPVEIFSLAIDFLKSPKIAWIEQSPDSLPQSPDVPVDSPDNLPPSTQQSTGEDRTRKTKQPASQDELLKAKFNEARKAYPGTKNGLEMEWKNFLSKNRSDASSIVPLLLHAIEAEKAHKAALKAAGGFCPEWAHFQTWINQGRWAQELSKVSVPKSSAPPSADEVLAKIAGMG